MPNRFIPFIKEHSSILGAYLTILLLLTFTVPVYTKGFITNNDSSIHQLGGSSIISQNFDEDNSGTGYLLGAHTDNINAPTASLEAGGPTGSGRFLRLASGGDTANHNSISFESTSLTIEQQLIIDFEFRITPDTGRADGFGVAFLDTAVYGNSGIVTPMFIGEEPNFEGSFGVGFDIYRSELTPGEDELNNNHLSLHYDDELIGEFDVSPLDLASHQWTHAQIILSQVGGQWKATVNLIQCGVPALTIIDSEPIPDFSPYTGRAHLAARSGGLTADYDIDNLLIQTSPSNQSIISFGMGCYAEVETAVHFNLQILRAGNLASSATVSLTTDDISASSPADFTALSQSISFAAGETTKQIAIPLNDDALDEGDETFLARLQAISGNVVISGGQTAVSTIIDDERASVEGHWGQPFPSEVLPIQAHLLPTGQVMYWDRENLDLDWDPNPRLWDPQTGEITHSATTDYELFCAGHSFLPDGRLFVAGGHDRYDGAGEDKASIYDPFTNSWESVPDMNAGRWYPTNVTLADGDVLVQAGTYAHDNDPDQILMNLEPQIYDLQNNEWITLSSARLQPYPNDADYYPYLYTAPNGKVFSAGPQQMARYLDVSGTGQWTDVAPSSLLYRDYGSSVMYEPGKVLVVGGNPRDPDLDNPTVLPSASAEIIDLNETDPAWKPVSPMANGRRQHNATILPNGTVLITGGSSAPGFDEQNGAVLEAELWNPADESWTTLAPQTYYRGYHSVALLLPDGRVLIGGGGHPNPRGGAQYHFQIYSPPYLFNNSRPEIIEAPKLIRHSLPFFIETSEDVSKVTLVRLASVTHSFDQNQRFNNLTFTPVANGVVAQTPANGYVAPPGHYMLYVLDENGVPSVSRMVTIINYSLFVPLIPK